jgi:hypothetical protein
MPLVIFHERPSISLQQHFFVNGQSRREYVEETSTHVLVRMHGDLKLSEPINGDTISKEGDHDWTQEFELSNDLIAKVDIKLFLAIVVQPPRK